MDNRGIQRLLASAGYYKGEIDGIFGDGTKKAVDRVLSNHFKPKDAVWQWPFNRRAVASAQIVLKFAGYDPGGIDGLAGHVTNDAFAAWDRAQAGQPPLQIDRTPSPGYTPGPTKFPSQSGCNSFYGMPTSPKLISQLKMYDLPLAMRIDYDLDTMVKRVQLHAKCGTSAMSAMEEIVRHYGEKRWRQLGLDRNAGTYNPRRMRGGTAWSMHAYGCAWDFNAGPNGLNTRCPQALFCGEEYRAFFDIWEKYGWTSLGRAIGRDWMHVQAASL